MALWGLAMGCTGEDTAGEGGLELTISGGGALRDGFPFKEGDVTQAFVDGWSVQFDTYVVVVGDVQLTDGVDGPVVGSWPGPMALDLAQSADAAETLGIIEGLPAKRLEFGFDFLAAEEGMTGSASAEDLAEMAANGWSMLVGGVATREGVEIRFRLGLAAATRYRQCVNGKDKTQGIAIEANKTTGAFIYAHAIHIFWDTLSAGNEDLRFDALAAVADADGGVTSEALTRQDLTDLRDADGAPLLDAHGFPLYDDGGLLPPGKHTLLDFLTYAARASGHFNGVGFCRAQPR
ncbi:hypothetical protein KKF91_01710 [Myxococcota bacterium]|nr:hypothetical protein [Myxococcota bacterium]MBU1897314.1 hypothetical protein [Myxococcota bacterium]